MPSGVRRSCWLYEPRLAVQKLLEIQSVCRRDRWRYLKGPTEGPLCRSFLTDLMISIPVPAVRVHGVLSNSKAGRLRKESGSGRDIETRWRIMICLKGTDEKGQLTSQAFLGNRNIVNHPGQPDCYLKCLLSASLLAFNRINDPRPRCNPKFFFLVHKTCKEQPLFVELCATPPPRLIKASSGRQMASGDGEYTTEPVGGSSNRPR